MNKKTNIIIISSISVLVLLLIISFTFAFYSTRIIGNKNEKSFNITVTGSVAKVTELDVPSNISLFSNTSNTMIEPGYSTVKKYTIQNIGSEKAIYSIYLTEVYNDFERYDDVRYILYRNKGNNSIGSNLDEYEIIKEGTYPRTDNLIVKDEVLDNPGDSYTYALKIIYNTSSENQNVDMDHTFSGKFTISGTSNDLNKFNESTLAYKIIDNSLYYKNNTVLRNKPINKIGQPIKDNELELIKVTDNYGDAYYYRGNVLDNYLELNDNCFRIVGILGNGTIKLILANEGLCSNSNETTGILNTVSYNMTNSVNYDSNYNIDIKSYLDNWVNNKNYNYITNTEWCNDIALDGNGIFAPYNRLKNESATLKCSRTLINSNVGILTSDEISIAGSVLEKDNLVVNTYLNQNAKNYKWWTMSGKEYNDVFVYDGNSGLLTSSNASSNIIYARPVIVINKDVLYLSGDGTINNPYKVK